MLLLVQAEKDKRNIVENPSQRDRKIDHCKPGSKTG